MKEQQLVGKHFRIAFEASPAMMSITRVSDWRFLEVNECWLKTLGYSREEIIGRTTRELNIAHVPDWSAHLTRLNEEGKITDTEIQYKTKTGEIRTALASMYMIDLDGEKCRLSVIMDITERKEAEKALRLSEERFYKAFHKSPIMMSIRSMADDTFVDINERWQITMGYSREEVIGRSARELGIWVENVGIKQKLAINEDIHDVEVGFRTKSGEMRVGLVSTEIIQLNDKPCRFSVIRDITKQKQWEKDLARLDRLNLVGEMAAGIAHEIRNPMTIIRGFLQLLGGKRENARYKDYYDLMLAEIDRANTIINEFLSLAKDKAVKFSRENLNNIIMALSEMISADALIKDKYLRLELEEIPDLMVDEKEIRQLVLNLARNGLEAMKQGGCLTIKTAADADGSVVLSVTDEGFGIPSHIVDKIGTPFFTTKENGTGLGLAICYSIAARHNASMQFRTSGQGTTFSVMLKPAWFCQA